MSKKFDCESNGVSAQLFFGDCVEIMDSMTKDSIDLIITDPPYNKGKEYLGNFSDQKSNKEFWFFNHNWIERSLEILKPGHHLYFSCASDQIFDFKECAENVGFEFRHLLIWATNECRGHMNRRTWLRSYEPILWFKKPGKTYGLFNNWPFSALDVILLTSPHRNTVGEDKKEHICQKPIELFENIIRKSSQEFDTILDPFVGSGTAIVAALKQKRFSIGIELSPEYCPVISKRVTDGIERINIMNSQEKITAWG